MVTVTGTVTVAVVAAGKVTVDRAVVNTVLPGNGWVVVLSWNTVVVSPGSVSVTTAAGSVGTIGTVAGVDTEPGVVVSTVCGAVATPVATVTVLVPVAAAESSSRVS